MWVGSLLMKSRKRLAYDILDAFATHAHLVCDIAVWHYCCMALLIQIARHKITALTAMFLQLSNVSKKKILKGSEIKLKIVVCQFFIPFLLMGLVMLLCFGLLFETGCTFISSGQTLKGWGNKIYSFIWGEGRGKLNIKGFFVVFFFAHASDF